MRKKISEIERDGLLWDATRRYVRGEISVEEMSEALSSYARSLDYVAHSAVIRYLLIFLTCMIAVANIIAYMISGEILMLTVTLVAAASIVMMCRDYLNKKKHRI